MEEEGSYLLSSDGLLGRTENFPFSKPIVNQDQERIKVSRDREVDNQVTGDLLEGV